MNRKEFKEFTQAIKDYMKGKPTDLEISLLMDNKFVKYIDNEKYPMEKNDLPLSTWLAIGEINDFVKELE